MDEYRFVDFSSLIQFQKVKLLKRWSGRIMFFVSSDGFDREILHSLKSIAIFL